MQPIYFNSNNTASECAAMLPSDVLDAYPMIAEWAASHDRLAEYVYTPEESEELADTQKTKREEEMIEDYAVLYGFFIDCFARLNGNYPTPSYTSDYDKSIIFDAIEKSEAT